MGSNERQGMSSFSSKQDAIRSFLDKGLTMVHLDARKDGVVVPRQFQGQKDLRLNLSYRFAGSHMEIDDLHVEATLTFGGMPFRCNVPLQAIYALTSQVTGAGLVFPESLPEEIVDELKRQIGDEFEQVVTTPEGNLTATTSSTTAPTGMPQQQPMQLSPQLASLPNRDLSPRRKAVAAASGSPRASGSAEGRPTKAPFLKLIDGGKDTAP